MSSERAMYGGMNDVTAKIAYAYAKQEVFAYVALVLLGVGAGAAGAEAGNLTSVANGLLLASGLVLLAGGATLLGVILPRKNLESINHTSLTIVGALFGLSAILLVASWVESRAWPGSTALFIGALLLLGSTVVGYPLPIRRGGAVLYSPAAVRELAHRRASMAGFVAILLFGVALIALPPAGVGSRTGTGTSSAVLLALVALGAAGLAVLYVVRDPAARSKVILGLAGVAGIVAVIAPIAAGADRADWWEFVPVAWVALAVPVVLLGLGERLNQGKTIVSRRA